MSTTTSKRDELQEVIIEAGVASQAESPELDFKDLMRHKVNNILLVSSRYDFYTLVDDGQLTEALMSEYLDLNLHYAPSITRVYSGEAALDALGEQHFDLVITMLRLGDMKLRSFCMAVKETHPALPIVLLAYQSRELQILLEQDSLAIFDRIFIWAGDRKLFLAVIKNLEDLQNAQRDCLVHGVRAIILVEDSPQFYSSYLPLIYTELIQQSQMLIEEGKNLSDKLLRQRARPKILHATTYEQAWNFFRTFKDVLLGIITDLKFKINGRVEADAGLTFIRKVHEVRPDLPIIVQSAQREYQDTVERLGAHFVDKYSRTLLLEVREFMKNNFGFGDFIFRLADGTEIDRARNVRELYNKLKEIPDESIWLHGSNDHFSNWLMARTKFRLAADLKATKSTSFRNADEIRAYMVKRIENLLIQEQRGIILDFSRAEYDRHATFLRIGGGSLGGKARGLAFIDNIFKNYLDPDYFPNVRISIPRTIVLGTDVFAQFMDINNLLPFVVQNVTDEEILQRFLAGNFPAKIEEDLRGVIRKYNFPLAVRSSSLLEDTLYQPFAGIYATLMIPNSNRNGEVRYRKLLQAIKYVYASTYFKAAKHYIEATGHRLEEEQMAVIIQQVSGRRYADRFYPHFSGVARSYNFYPFGDARQTDGIVSLALGLGKTIVEGGLSLQFCPALPSILPQFSTTKDYFTNNQRKFWALDLGSDIVKHHPTEEQHLVHLDSREAEAHGVMQYIASTYDAGNDTLMEGIYRDGYRVLDFAPILQSEIMPLAKILKLLLRLCETAMNCPVEIEFAGNIHSEGGPEEFAFLQVRPMVREEAHIEVNLDDIDRSELVLKSEQVLGNGIYRLRDIVFIKPDVFDHAKTREIAAEMDAFNRRLVEEQRPYLLIGPGRWGSSDHWLGIPVKFTSISGAHAIVETSLPNMLPDPSQGSHFFQNLTSFRIAYFTTRHYKDGHQIDWEWLGTLRTVDESGFIRHVEADADIEIVVDGHSGHGAVFKHVRARDEGAITPEVDI